MKKTLFRMVSHFFFPKGMYALGMLLFVAFLYALGGWVIYLGGGTSQSYVHILYVPIIFLGLSYGLVGGLVAGVTAALTAGPWMPMSVCPLLEQSQQVWMFRGLFFIIIGGLTGLGSAVFRNFSEMQKQRLLTDPITGLYNLRGLKNAFDQHSEDSLKNPHFSVVLIELRQLPHIEKAIGPETTQKLLRLIAYQLKDIIKDKSLLGYLETGSFVLATLEPQQGSYLVDMCHTLLGSTFTVDDIPMFVEFHYGVAHATEEDPSLVSTLRKAKVAAVKAMTLRRPASFYSIDDDFNSKRNIRITHDLNYAILNDQLKLVYQPKVNLKTFDIIGAEALVRWPHPELGIVSPAEFIPVIESTLLINPFTKWMLQEAVHQMLAWREQSLELPIAVNFSMMNFQDPTVIEHLMELLRLNDISPKQIEIEVTETAVAQNIKQVADVLHSMREQGFRIAIDDFGTGQSSMQYLCELPVDTIKIDRFFIQDMLTNSASEAIVRSSILLGHELNLSVIAEGIETQTQLDKLITIGCDYGQGFFLFKPMSPEDLSTRINLLHK